MTVSRAHALLTLFAKQRVLVVGDLMLDRYVLGTVDRISPEAPVPVLQEQEIREMPGGAGNTARNLAALGGQATLIACVGADRAGEHLTEILEAAHIRPALIQDHRRPTTQKTRFVQKGHQLLRVDTECGDDIAPAVEEQVSRRALAELAAQDALIISDYAKGLLTPAVASALTTEGRARSLLMAADVKPRSAALFTGVSLMCPNEREAHEFLGADARRAPRPPVDLAREISRTFETDAYVTLGERGMAVHPRAGAEPCHVPQVHAREVFDVSGAGDTAIAALTLALLAGASPREAAELANAVCAVVVAKAGAASATPAEVLAVFERVPERVDRELV